MNAIRLLALIPFIAMLAGGYLASRVPTLVFGFPFLMVWNLGWMVACSVILIIVYRAETNKEETTQ